MRIGLYLCLILEQYSTLLENQAGIETLQILKCTVQGYDSVAQFGEVKM